MTTGEDRYPSPLHLTQRPGNEDCWTISSIPSRLRDILEKRVKELRGGNKEHTGGEGEGRDTDLNSLLSTPFSTTKKPVEDVTGERYRSRTVPGLDNVDQVPPERTGRK